MSDLKDIVARAERWVFEYEDIVEDLVALIRSPDPPQVHIPGLDQTEWKCV